MSIWWWMAAVLMLLAAALLMLTAQRDRPSQNIQQRFREVLHKQGQGIAAPARLEGFVFQDWLQNLLRMVSKSEMAEMEQQLMQAGWGSQKTRLYYLAAAWFLPLFSGLLSAIYALIAGETFINALFYLVFGFAIIFVLMRRFLQWKAYQRREAIRKEVVPFLHLLRMLFDAGLSLEHILQIVQRQGRDLIPHLAQELKPVLKRIEAGQDRGIALSEMAAPLGVAELNDTIAMLKQVTRYGGNIRDSLEEYTQLVEQRQVSQLRERVSKLSAKMSIVMIVFLFPSLMIFLAGPGFLGLAKALKGFVG
jgi:tight adherence protein C